VSTTLDVKLSREELLELFLHNRSVPDADQYARMLDIEHRWIVPWADEVERESPVFEGRGDLVAALKSRLAEEEANPTESDRFLAEQASREQFGVVVADFAIDGLTEAQSFFPVLQRLPHRAQMAVLRVLIDEFGCGNVEQSHSQLYRNLLTELGLSINLEDYYENVSAETLSFVNLFYWMAARAPEPEYFLGALAYLEASILYAFRPFAAGAERLGLAHGRYYTEHLHIDNYHMKEMQIAIRELDAVRPIGCQKVWTGVELASMTIGGAIDAAVAKARAVGP
jgi:hypothetical protein